jgi:hypothetical protein
MISRNTVGTRCGWLLLSVVFVLGMFFVPAGGAEAAPDPKLVAGPENCGECHKAAVESWRKTKHFAGYRKLTRRKEAKAIAKKMGIKRIKRESLCMDCHFTSIIKGKRAKPIAGVSCESCHAPAKNWVDVHQDFGGKDATSKTETVAHRKARIAKLNAAGMIRPMNIYNLATNCIQCHTVPFEKLVNVGGHTPGSKFELVSWSQGEVRHNFVASQEKSNAEASPKRKRVLFMVGKAVELEYNLRGVAKATKKDTYAVKMARRAKAAIDTFKKVAGVVSTPEVKEILAVAASVKLKLNNEAALLAAAEKISKSAQKLAAGYDGSAWAALDSMIPTKYQGTPTK